MGVSLNGGTPISHPKMIIFEQENPWLLGTSILGTPYIDPMGYINKHLKIRVEEPGNCLVKRDPNLDGWNGDLQRKRGWS